MAYKNALAGLDLGGGKAVIWGDPDQIKSEALLRAYGRFVESLGGRYYTACDVGTYVPDMDVVARETRFVTGRSESSTAAPATPRSSPPGASSRACGRPPSTRWGTPDPGRPPGRHRRRWARSASTSTGHLLEDGASVVATDVNPSGRSAWVRADPPAGRPGRRHRRR